MLHDQFRLRWRRSLIRAFCLGAIASLLLATALQAADPDQKSPTAGLAPRAVEVVQPDAVTADDGGQWELGVHGTAGDLPTATAAERYGMWVWLNGWFVRRYSYDESTAWEEDFKRSVLGGTENSYIDSVDLQFYVGHGSPGRFTFANTSHDDSTLLASNDCNTTWGDGDNEWLALTSCQVLADSGLGAMAQCMNRQHLILGFVTNASAHNYYWNTQAYWYGYYLRHGYNQTQAWFKGCDIAQRGRIARVLAEETYHFSDNPYYGVIYPDVLDSDYYWYTHSCGTPSAGYVPVDQFQQLEVPIFKVNPYSTAEAQRDFNRLGDIFNVPVTGTLQSASVSEDGDPPPAVANNPFFVSQTSSSQSVSQTLELDKGSGLFHYADLSQLYNEDQVEQALALRAANATYITQDDARQIADSFLTNNNLMEQDAVFAEVVSDTVGTLAKGQVSAATVQQAETPTVMQVIYERQLSAPLVMASGVTQNITFTVVGPGAKQKVSIPAAAVVNAAGVLQNQPVDVQGGWRDVSPQVNAASGALIMAPIYDAATAQALYLALDKEVTMNSIPLDIKSREILSSTLAYWEHVAGASQGELIPVYEFKVRFVERNTDAVSEDFVYVPASAQYLPPIARITNAPLSAQSGVSLTLTAADATQTLSQIDPEKLGNFNFVAGYNGANGTYTYEWYLGGVAPENKITDLNTGDGLTNITFEVPESTNDHDHVVDVYLVVTDTDSPNDSASTAVAQIQVPKLYLPLVDR